MQTWSSEVDETKSLPHTPYPSCACPGQQCRFGSRVSCLFWDNPAMFQLWKPLKHPHANNLSHPMYKCDAHDAQPCVIFHSFLQMLGMFMLAA